MDILEIKDLETLAQKRVPKMFFDYVNSGSWTETTYNENMSCLLYTSDAADD